MPTGRPRHRLGLGQRGGELGAAIGLLRVGNGGMISGAQRRWRVIKRQQVRQGMDEKAEGQIRRR